MHQTQPKADEPMAQTSHLGIQYPHRILFGLPIYDGSLAECAEYLTDSIKKGQFQAIATPNPEQIVQAKHDPSLSTAWQSFTVFIPDGQGMIWASRKKGQQLTSRIAGVDLVRKLLKVMADYGETGVLVGSENIAEKYLTSRVDGVAELEIERAKIWWLESFAKAKSRDNQAVLQLIREKSPTIVFVALGAPDQEQWVAQHRSELEAAGVKCVMVVGGAFDMILGRTKRAPRVMRLLGLEWLWRLVLQPWRIGRQWRLVEFVRMVGK